MRRSRIVPPRARRRERLPLRLRVSHDDLGGAAGRCYCRVREPGREVKMKPFSTLACILLGLVSLLQLARFLLAWPVTVNGIVIPVWPSAVAFVVAGGLAAMVWRESRG